MILKSILVSGKILNIFFYKSFLSDKYYGFYLFVLRKINTNISDFIFNYCMMTIHIKNTYFACNKFITNIKYIFFNNKIQVIKFNN